MEPTLLFFDPSQEKLQEYLLPLLGQTAYGYRLFAERELALSYAAGHEVDYLFLNAGNESISDDIEAFQPSVKAFALLGANEDLVASFAKRYPNKSFFALPLPLDLSALEGLSSPKKGRIYFQCFGPFDIFVDGKPVVFHSKKAKELLAIMVAYPDSTFHLDYVISLLWPKHDTFLAKRLYRDASFRLRSTLKEVGAESVVSFGHASCHIEKAEAECDYWSFLKGEGDQPFCGEFMSGYFWTTPLKIRLGNHKL